MQVRNQTYLRKKNKEDVINLLRRHSRSYSDIARELRLSNTAIGKIADDLIADDLIKREGNVKGRSGITLSINADFGYVFALDFSGRELTICAADLESNVLAERKIPEVVRFGKKDFSRVMSVMREMMSDEKLSSRALRCVSVATPGKLKSSGEFLLNPRFEGFENISMEKVLSDEFCCSVIVKNDVNLAMEGEKAYGRVLSEVKNALMLHVDVGTGAALMFNDKVYDGCHGFAGEIGYFKLNMLSVGADSHDNLSYANFYDSLSLFSSLSILKREVTNGVDGYLKDLCKSSGIAPADLTIRHMIEAYRSGDAVAQRVLNSSARVIGTVAANLAEFLDIEVIILNGAVIELGEDFLQVVAEYADGRRVLYPDMKENASIMGAINAGVSRVFLDNF